MIYKDMAVLKVLAHSAHLRCFFHVMYRINPRFTLRYDMPSNIKAISMRIQGRSRNRHIKSYVDVNMTRNVQIITNITQYCSQTVQQKMHFTVHNAT